LVSFRSIADVNASICPPKNTQLYLTLQRRLFRPIALQVTRFSYNHRPRVSTR